MSIPLLKHDAYSQIAAGPVLEAQFPVGFILKYFSLDGQNAVI